MSSGHREGGPRSSIALGRHVCCSTSTARRPNPRIEDGEGVVAPREFDRVSVMCLEFDRALSEALEEHFESESPPKGATPPPPTPEALCVA
jgi:hypothetical protein